jgi:hypothetical protein
MQNRRPPPAVGAQHSLNVLRFVLFITVVLYYLFRDGGDLIHFSLNGAHRTREYNFKAQYQPPRILATSNLTLLVDGRERRKAAAA